MNKEFKIILDNYNVTNQENFYENGVRYVNKNSNEIIWRSIIKNIDINKTYLVVVHDRTIENLQTEGISIWYYENEIVANIY